MNKIGHPTWQPKPDDYAQVFVEQNPWHRDGKVPEVLAYSVERPLAKQLWRQMKGERLCRYELVLGPRRVGKTTVLYQTVRHLLQEGVPPHKLWWLRLDHPLLMEVPLNKLVEWVIQFSHAVPGEPVYLFLDELTYADSWDLWLKTFYDERRPIRVVASSSSTAALRGRLRESGVGRWNERYLAPYLFPEYLDLLGVDTHIQAQPTLAETIAAGLESWTTRADLTDRRRRFMLTGGFPELLMAYRNTSSDDASLFLESQRTLRNDAVERAVYKDIPQAFGVESPMLLERMLYLLAAQVTGVLSPNNICQALHGLTQPTFDRYLAYLTQAFLVFTLPNYAGSEPTRQKRGRKLYFVDGAIRNAALQRGTAPLRDPTEMGMLKENLLAAHLHALGQTSQVRLYHWREGDQREVDLVYDHPESPLAFEVGSSPSHSRRGLIEFAARHPRFRGGCYMVCPEITPTRPSDNTGQVGTLPLDLALLAAGAQAERELAAALGV